MRLSEQQIRVLKNSVQSLDALAKLYLFGSRVDDNKKGGDIDLLIKSEKINKLAVRDIRLNFFTHFGEQKMDILIQNKNTKDAFINKIQTQLIKL